MADKAVSQLEIQNPTSSSRHRPRVRNKCRAAAHSSTAACTAVCCVAVAGEYVPVHSAYAAVARNMEYRAIPTS